MTETESSSGKRKALVLIVLVVAALVAVRLLPVADWLEQVQEFIEDLGVWGPVVFVGVYVLATVLFAPGLPLTLAAGALWGVWQGTAIVSVASTLGATSAFVVGRHLARDWVEQRIADSKRFGAIDRAVKKGGMKVVLLVRLSPIVPFNLLNYALGLTGVRPRNYVLGSWIGMLPGTLMYVYFGYAASEAVSLVGNGVERSTAEWVARGVGLVVAVIVTVYVTRLARRELDEDVLEDTEASA